MNETKAIVSLKDEIFLLILDLFGLLYVSQCNAQNMHANR